MTTTGKEDEPSQTQRHADMHIEGDRSELGATKIPQKEAATTQGTARREAGVIASKPTLRQAWHQCGPMPQYAFKISMFNVSCNSQ